jgi:hydroxymethylglutaryl-CoA lyase
MSNLAQSKKFIFIREVGPREGVQSYSSIIPTEDKLKLIGLLDKANFPEIEATALVRPDKVPQMADSDKILDGLPLRQNGVFSALYLNDKGFLRSKGFGNISTQGWIQSSVSQTFLQKNSNQNFEQHFSSINDSVNLYKSNNCELFGIMLSNSFGCNYEGAISASDVSKFVEKLLNQLSKVNLSPTYIILADTTGLGSPVQVEAAITLLRKEYSKIKIGLHLHDTRGLGIANAYVGLKMDVDYFDSSITGIGGCPFTPKATGNIATEELVFLCESLGFETGIDHKYLKEAGQFALKIFKGKTSSRLASTW